MAAVITQESEMVSTAVVRRLRVLYFIGSYGPEAMGTASHEETIRALQARGHQIDVLTQVNKPGEKTALRSTYNGVTVFEVNVAGGGRPVGRALGMVSRRLFQYEYVPVLLRALRALLAKKSYDLIHAEGAYPFGFVAALGAGRVPVLANVQGADVINLPDADYGYRRFRLPRAAVAYALSRASVVRVISPLLLSYLEAERLAKGKAVRVVLRALEEDAFPPAGIDLDTLRAEGRKLLAEKHGIGIPRPVVIALSRLHPFKGLEYLVDAVRILSNELESRDGAVPWFVICGPSRSTETFGDYREFLRKRAQDAGIAHHVVFTGEVSHDMVRHYLAGADIVVCPSILEAQNKVVPEACAVGTPSVVTETTGIAGYLAPEEACVAIPPRSAQAIADAMLSLLEDRALYRHVQQNALRMAETLRADQTALQLESVWLEAAQGVD